MRRFLLFLSILVLLFLLSELLLPRIVTYQLEEALQDSLEEVEGLAINVKATPSLALLFGHIKEAHIEGEGLLIQGLRIHHFFGRYENLTLPPIWRWRGGSWSIEGSNSFLEVLIKEKDLNDYVAFYFQDLLQMEVTLLEEGVYLSTRMDFYNHTLLLRMEGDFQVEGPQNIRFVPRDLTIENFQIPTMMVEYLMDELDFSLDMGPIPLPVHVTHVITRKGELFFHGGDKG